MRTHDMTRRLGWVLGVALAGFAAAQETNSYEVIAKRNLFGLRPVTENPVTAPPPQSDWKPPPDLKITGMVVLPPVKKVSLYSIEHGKPPKSYVLGEGEEAGEIKVVTIDAKNETVRIKNRDVFVVLDFKTHGLKPTDILAGPLPLPLVAAPAVDRQ